MRLFHTTSPESARGILAEGFRDTYSERHDGRTYRGSCFSDGWLKEIGPALLVIEIPDEIARPFELPAELHCYRRWVIPSSVLTVHGPVREVGPEGRTLATLV